MGTILALLAALLNSAKDTTSKYLASDVDPNVSTFASFLFALPYYVVVLVILWAAGLETVTLSAVFLGYVGLRALTDTATESCKMHALAHGELSVVSALIALNPAIILLLSPFITGDHIRPAGVAGIVVAVVGNMFFVYRSGLKTSPRALVLGAACAFFMALNTCFDRMSVQHGTPVFSGFMMTLLSAVFLLRVLPAGTERSQLRMFARPFAARGAFETAFMVSKLCSLQYLAAAETASLVRLSLLVSVITGRTILDEQHFFRKLFGALLMVCGTSLMLLG